MLAMKKTLRWVTALLLGLTVVGAYAAVSPPLR